MKSVATDRIVVIAGLAESLVNFRGALLKELVSRGYEVIALAPDSEPVRARLASMGVSFLAIPVSRSGLNPLRDLALLVHLIRVLVKISPRLVFSYTVKPVIYGGFACKFVRKSRCVAMITGLGYAFSSHSFLARQVVGRLVRLLYRGSLGRADAVLFQNPDDLDAFCRMGLVRKSVTMLVNGSGVDTGYFACKPIPTGTVFLMVARLIRDKGVVEYLCASEIVRKEFPDIRCLLVGGLDPNPSGLSQRELEQLLSSRAVEYLGELADVRPALEQCSVFVLPSYREGTPRSVLEAMSTGRAIITTDAPGCRETIEDGVSGILVPVGSVSELADAMKKLVRSRELVSQMAAAARRRAVEKYDVALVNKTMLRAFSVE